MKLIEKLAVESFKSAEGSSIDGKEKEYLLHCGCLEDFQRGFEAGFKKARYLALEANGWPDKKYFIDGFGNPDGNPRHIAVHEAIKDLGESEVEE